MTIKTLATSVCLKFIKPLILLGLFTFPACAEPSLKVHPDVGTKTPNELLAKEVMALPERERLAWIHGAVSLMAQTTAATDPVKARCFMDWYFAPKGAPETVQISFERWPDSRAASVVVAVASTVCKVN